MLPNPPYIIVLGTAQDGGYPQAGCRKECCKRVWQNPSLRRLITSLAIINPRSNEAWIIDATPDLKEQLHVLYTLCSKDCKLSGIFLTHGHTGHYTGLIYLSREVMNTNNINVYAMPMMLEFLNNNAPWDQLIFNNNIGLNPILGNNSITLTANISLLPIIVPHRGEITETVGYKIAGPNKSVLFIPDIDYWDDKSLHLIDEVDTALVDGTFYDKSEVPERDLRVVSHPLVADSIQLFDGISIKRKVKIYFIHFNHTNPVLNPKSKEHQSVTISRYKLASEKQIIEI